MSSRKSVLITGCSAGGIGGALAEAFHTKGYHVFATARDPLKISQSLSAASNVTVLKLDVLSSESIAAAVQNVRLETKGKLDVLINNSGGALFGAGLDASIEEGKKLFDLNFWAPLAMLQAFAPLLIEAKGCVINNSSVSARMPTALMSLYNASKAAFAMASETWRHELQPLGVRTLTLITCTVKTNFFANNTEVHVPENSYYSSIRGFISSITDGRLQASAMSAEQYASSVVREVEKGSSGEVWLGKDALSVRLACSLLPQSIFDKIVESVIPISSEMGKVAQGKQS